MVFKFKDLESLLVCPGSRTPLLQDGDWLKYAIRDDIPIMLVDEAVKLSPEEWGAIMQKHARDVKTGQEIGTNP